MPAGPSRELPLPLHLVASHPDFILVAKPPGLGFHAETADPGLVALARAASGTASLYPVHRLDRITSGLVLLARHADAARAFGEMLAAGAVEKYYLAISARPPAKKQGAISGTMLKGRNGSWRLGRDGGPQALTQFFSHGLGDGTRLFVLRPRSGRTHQLRVAMKSLGSPILGDLRYGGADADRGYLHAWALRFAWQGETREFILPPAIGERFTAPACAARLATLTPPWQLPWPPAGRAGPRPSPGE